MPGFESPISNRKFSAQPMRDVEVPDESGYAPPPQPAYQHGQHQFQQSASRRYNNPMNEQELADFQARMESQFNPDSNLSEIEREVKQARQDKQLAQSHLNEGARRRIEMLIGMTRMTRNVEIEGNSYVLQTLKGKEMRDAILSASEFNGTVQFPFEIRRQMLARSLRQIANISVEQFLGTYDLQARFDFIDELDDTLLNRLMDEYSALTNEAKTKYALTTTEQVKEVAEELKK